MAGRVAAITGAFGVLGSGVAGAAKQQGWALALIDAAPAPQGGSADILMLGQVDLTDAAAAVRAVEQVNGRFGRLDALLNIAGGFSWMTLADSSPGDWERLYRLNVLT